MVDTAMANHSSNALHRTTAQVEQSQVESSPVELPISTFAYQHLNSKFPNFAIEELIDGVLVVTHQRELVYANDCARRVLEQLKPDKSQGDLIPKEIWHICQSLIHSRSLFPNQHWLIESEIFTDDATALHIRVKWLKLEAIAQPYLLITVEDRHQAIRTIAVEEAQHYRLTSREKEVWLLHRDSYISKLL